MNSREAAALDRHITGNYGEDQFAGLSGRCGEGMRTGPCTLDPGHRGRHTTVSFYCDLCGKERRGQPYRVMRQRQADDYWEEMGEACFMCVEVIR